MFAYVNVESSKLIQLDIIGASLAIPPLQIEATTKKVLYPLHHPFCYKLIETSYPRFSYTQALNLLALSYSFNLEEYLDEDEISSSATSSEEALLEETYCQCLRRI